MLMRRPARVNEPPYKAAAALARSLYDAICPDATCSKNVQIAVAEYAVAAEISPAKLFFIAASF
ncbi:MAG: hypothetical protein P4L87_21485 [Formivibrio sp.]|nr:hypothetical protein [Formivibrio sp.]